MSQTKPAAPVIAKKLSAKASAEAIGKELDRRAHIYRNEIHPEKTHLNQYMINGEWSAHGHGEPVPLERAIDGRISELVTKRKIRADAVKAVGFVVSSNAQLDDELAITFLHDSYDWFANRYGKENIVAAAIHMDEDTPHMQMWIVPVIHDYETGYDRLSARTLFTPNKVDRAAKKVIEEGTLAKLQREFYDDVAKGYGFGEPFTHEQRMANGRIYRSQEAYKADMAARRALAAAEKAEAREKAAEARTAVLEERADAAIEVLHKCEGLEGRTERAIRRAEEHIAILKAVSEIVFAPAGEFWARLYEWAQVHVEVALAWTASEPHKTEKDRQIAIDRLGKSAERIGKHVAKEYDSATGSYGLADEAASVRRVSKKIYPGGGGTDAPDGR